MPTDLKGPDFEDAWGHAVPEFESAWAHSQQPSKKRGAPESGTGLGKSVRPRLSSPSRPGSKGQRRSDHICTPCAHHAEFESAWGQSEAPRKRKQQEQQRDLAAKPLVRGSTSTSSTSGAQGPHQPKRAQVELTPGALLPAIRPGASGGEGTSYQQRGACAANVEERWLKARSFCRCAKETCPCCAAIPLKSLISVCRLFWGLQDLERAVLVRGLYLGAIQQHDPEKELTDLEKEASHPQQHGKMRVQWSLCGRRVCFHVWTRLLGTSHTWVHNSLHAVPDMRRSIIGHGDEYCPAARDRPQTDLCHQYFLELYQSAAEPLPEDAQCAEAQGPEIPGEGADPWAAVPPDAADTWNPDAPNPTAFIAAALTAGTIDSDTVLGLPRRYLPHGTPTDIYWMFVGWCDCHNVVPASYSTFWRSWAVWKKYLRHKKESQHAQCNTCFELQKTLHSTGSSWADKVTAGRDLRAHYRHQHQDRRVYYGTRWLSRQNKDVLTIIIDTVDRAKFAWPRWMWAKVSKEISGLLRPRTVLTAAIAHGFCTILFVQNESLNHGSDFFCDVLCQTLEQVWSMCQAPGAQKIFPRHLVIQSDNTTSQAKNQYACLFLAHLVGRYKFITITLNFLTVGHTHEDIDQLFAVILWLLGQKLHWQTERELLEYLVAQLRMRAAKKGEEVYGVFMNSVRDFASWLAPLAMVLDNAFGTRGGIEAPHSFAFKLRQDLTAAERQELATAPRCPGVWEPDSPDDVFCCVKTYMRDMRLQQPPVLACPGARIHLVQGSFPPTIVPRKALSKEALTSALKLADLCCHELGMPRAGAALRDYVYKRAQDTVSTQWLQAPGAPHAPIPVLSAQFPHLPETSWQLRSLSW